MFHNSFVKFNLNVRNLHFITNFNNNYPRRNPKHDLCGTILLYEHGTEYQTPMTSAQVIFRYPIVGQVIFRQPQDRPWEDTTIIIESMVTLLLLLNFIADGQSAVYSATQSLLQKKLIIMNNFK